VKRVNCWQDLEPSGVLALTGEACGLGYRLLCDVTKQGRRALARCLGMPGLRLAEPWNRGKEGDPHVASVLLAPELLVPVGVFALLEGGCAEVWQYADGGLVGLEPSDDPVRVARARQVHADTLVRTFALRGTAGDRNVHLMSGRVE
jgi:hypothetical protein